MRRVAFLGTASAVTKPGHDYTALAFDIEGRVILVDTGTNVFAAMQHAGINPLLLSDIVVTHRHIDHIGGLPALLDQMRLAIMGTSPGLRRPVRLYGLAETLAVARGLLDLYRFEEIERTLDVQFVSVQSTPAAPVLSGEDFTMSAFPAVHGEPCITLRLECADGAVVAYSADTEPHDGMSAAYADTDLLIHECTFTAADTARGVGGGHCTTANVAAIAHANAPLRLALVHLGWQALADLDTVRREVAAGFHGTIILPKDGESLTF